MNSKLPTQPMSKGDWAALKLVAKVVENRMNRGEHCDDYQIGFWIALRQADMAKSALRAIAARVHGIWDDPDLMRLGPLTTETADILRLCESTLEDLEEEPPIDPDLIDRMNRSGIVCGNCGCDLHIDGTCPEGCTNDATTGESGPYSADEGEENVR